MITSFIEDNFFYLHPGYTLFNTVIFGIVLGLIILVIIRLFDKLNKNPADLIVPLIPMIFFGSSSRALVDNHIYPRIHLLATPGIYIFIGLLTIAILLISINIEKKTGYEYTNIIFISGLMFSVGNIILILLHHINIETLLFELLFFIIVSSPFIFLRNRMNFFNDVNVSVLLAHIFDATSTFVAMAFFNYQEQHVIPTFLIDNYGSPIIMYPVKIIVILVILYIIDREIENKTANNLLKLSIFILGLAPGIRNCLTLIMSVL